MGFQKGRLTLRRYRVLDPVPESFRDTFESALTEQAFRDTAALSRGEEALGWVCHDNIMDTEFSNRDRWLFDHFILLTLRVDKKASQSGARRTTGTSLLPGFEQISDRPSRPT